jgi:hypothetical protein
VFKVVVGDGTLVFRTDGITSSGNVTDELETRRCNKRDHIQRCAVAFIDLLG